MLAFRQVCSFLKLKSYLMKNIIIIAFISLIAIYEGVAQTSMSLQEAIDYAMQNNPEIANARLDILDADAQVTQSKAIGLPR